MIDFKDPYARMRIAISKRIEPGAKQDILPDAALDGGGELVFGDTAADDQQGANEPRTARKFVAIVKECVPEIVPWA